ncbi:MAG TPA: DNA modification methylase [Patescibacteria group bacterium]|nr:DNA modification methylase [Patescibacteria group bacterium]
MQEIKYVPIDSIKLHPDNPRLIKDNQFKLLCESIRKNPDYFETRPILINGHGIIFAGNMRWRAAKEIGLTAVPVAMLDISEERQQELMLRDNIQNGEWDTDMLASFDPELLKSVGFEPNQLAKMGFPAGAEDDFDADAELAKTAETKTKLGDVWALGKHKLMCADCTIKENVEKLMGGVQAKLMVTDPPYGVSYDPEWRDGVDLGVGERSKGKVENDDRVDWQEAYTLFSGDVAYVWHAGKFTDVIATNLKNIGFEIINQIIWVKHHFVISRGDYHWQHEPCLYAVRKGSKHNWQGARDQTTVWEIENNNSFGKKGDKEETWGHGTQKPIECMLKPILNNTAEADIVYDPFGGSGTTLIAAEQTDRICYMMELDPKYCDVIIARWEKLTGQTAQKL